MAGAPGYHEDTPSMTSPESFSNVTAKAVANVFFQGRVVSHSIVDDKGVRRSLGVVQPGAYTFTTAAPEIMEITAGVVRAKVDGEDEWGLYTAGQSFHVPANTSFEMVVEEDLAQYICIFG